MWRTILLVGAVLAVAAIVPAAKAESASDLLEKGIYTEETAGDLDKAIAIYQKVIAEAKASRLLAAQAQYHIGQCLLKKGKKAEATAAFAKLISDFPEAKDLMAKASKFVPSGVPLEAVPWVDGEVLQFRLRLVTGMDLGAQIYTIHSAVCDGRKIWRVGSRNLVILAGMNGASRVDADWDTFRPINSEFTNSLLGNSTTKYSDNQASVTVEGPNGKTSHQHADFKQTVYDNEQGVYVIRRLPLALGYQGTLPVLTPLGPVIEIPLEVAKQRDMIDVPAGKFECFNGHLGLVNQTFWYTTDAHRYLVKFSASGVDAELTSISQDKPGQLRPYANDKFGIAMSAPQDWFFYSGKPLKHAAEVYLLNLHSTAVCRLLIDTPKQWSDAGEKLLRSWADAGIDEGRKMEKDFKVRADSWQPRTVSGLPALNVIADYTDGTRKMVEYDTYVAAKAAGLKLKFIAALPPDEFATLRPPLDAIIESLKVKQP